MSNEQIQTIEQPLRPKEVQRVDVTAYEDNVISFPIRRTGIEHTMRDQGVLSDPEGSVQIDDQFAAARDHADYLESQQSIRDAIAETRNATVEEKVRQSLLTGNSNDRKAERKSARAHNSIEGLQRPAGTNRAIGRTALRFKEN